MKSEESLIESVTRLKDGLQKFKEAEDAREKVNDRHRLANTIFIMLLCVCVTFGYFKFRDYKFEQDYKSEIGQILKDESVRYTVYTDSLGNETIGAGHLVKPGEEFGTMTPHEVINLLISDYAIARDSVQERYPWAEGDVKLVLINMTFQMGPSRLAKFENALAALRDERFDIAAAELLDSAWAKQTPNRAHRLAGRILQLDSSVF